MTEVLNIEAMYGKEFEDVFKRVIQMHPYSEELRNLDGIGNQLNYKNFYDNYFKCGSETAVADNSVDANANIDDNNVISYSVETQKPFQRLHSYYLLYTKGKELFGAEEAEEMIRLAFDKSIYINDFHKFGLFSYCFNFSCIDVHFQGLPFVTKIKSESPNHLNSYIGQMTQFVSYASNSIAGACGLADFLLVASYYVKKDYEAGNFISEHLFWKNVKQELQSFIYSVNQPFKLGVESAFTNISIFDDEFLNRWCGEYHFIDGSQPDIQIVKQLQELYVDLMNETLEHTICTFPVTTACFAVDDERNILDKQFLRFIAEKDKKNCFINIYAGKTSTVSSCCRLRNEGENEYFNQFGAGGTKIGSLGVCTVNLPRVASESLSLGEFKARIKSLVEIVAKINHVKRMLIKEKIDKGYLPLYTLGFMNIKRQYSTFGHVGHNEALKILGLDITTKEGIKFETSILELINKENKKWEQKFKFPHNSEQVPGENSSVKLARADKILGYDNGYAFYSNQFVPLIENADLLDRIYIQGQLDKHMTGGAVLHINEEKPIEDTETIEKLIQSIVKMGVVYHARNHLFAVCSKGHINIGHMNNCQVCGKPIIDTYLRVVGFITNTKNWIKERREQDFPHRKFY